MHVVVDSFVLLVEEEMAGNVSVDIAGGEVNLIAAGRGNVARGDRCGECTCKAIVSTMLWRGQELTGETTSS